MNTLFLVVAATLFGAGPEVRGEEELSAEQFLRFVQSQQAPIHDVAFAFEGEKRYVGPPDEHADPLMPYQGRYALRSDGAMFLEHFYEIVDDRNVGHPVRAMVGGKGEMAQVTPNFEAESHIRIARMGAGPGSYFGSNSPEAFQFLWRYQCLKNVEDFGYRFVGWEDVDGHRCAHIEFDAHPRTPGRVLKELWVDLERGAHPLRIRNSDGGQTIYLIDQIRLQQFSLPGVQEAVWFPVTGVFNDFSYEGQYTKDASYQSLTYVLDGTLILNQGLEDGVFHVTGKSFRPAFRPDRPAAPVPTQSRRPGFDLIDAEKKLDAALADPSRKTPEGDASASLRAEGASASALPWTLAGLGAAILVVAGIVALRRR